MAGNRSLGSLTLDLVLKMGGFTAGMDKAARDADKRLSEIERRAYKFGQAIGTGLKYAGAAAATALASITALTLASIQNADQLDEMSQKLGVTTEQLSKWGYAAKLSGTDLDGLSRGITLLSKNMAAALDGDSSKGKLFDALGVSIKDAAGNLRSVESVLPEIADAFKGLNNQTLETAISMELFGKSGADLLEFLNRGSDGIDELGAKFESLGGVISSDTAAAAAEFNDQLDNLRVLVGGVGNTVARDLLPALNKTVIELQSLVKQGDLARNIASLLSGVLSFGVGVLNEYNNAVARLSITMVTLSESASGSIEAMKNLASFGAADGSVVGGMKRQIGAWRDGQKALDDLVASQQRAAAVAANAARLPDNFSSGPSSRRRRATPEEIEQTRRDAEAKATEARLASLLGGGSGGGGSKGGRGGGKSEEQREAEQLQQSYQRLIESLEERTFLIGKEGEAAQVSYDTQYGALKDLGQVEKDRAIAAAEKYDADLKAFRVAEEKERVEKRSIENAVQMREDYEFEVQLLGKTIEEQERLIELRRLGAAAATAEGKAAIKALEDYQAQARATADNVALMDGFRGEFENFFSDVISGTRSVSDAFKDMLSNIAAQIAQRIAENWVEKLFGQMGSTQGGAAGGDWLSTVVSLFGSYGGGRAAGGAFSGGSIYRVNESGLEMASVGGRDYLLTGGKGGYITPANRMGGGGTVVQNFYNPVMNNRATEAQKAQEQAAFAQRQSVRNS